MGKLVIRKGGRWKAHRPFQKEFFDNLLVNDIPIEGVQVAMTAAPFQGVHIVTTKDTDGYCSPPGAMGGDHLPFRDRGDHKFPVDPFLYTDKIRETDVPHKDVEAVIVVADVPFVWGIVSVSLQDAVCGL